MRHSFRNRFLCVIFAFFTSLVCACSPDAAKTQSGNGGNNGVSLGTIGDGGASQAQKCHMEYAFRGLGDNIDIWYSDHYFDAPSTEYNPHLATLSSLCARYSMMRSGPSSPSDDEFYGEQPKRVKAFYEAIGFGTFAANDDYYSRTRFDTIGVACASKKVGDCAIVSCVIRSGGYFNEWENNVFLGDGSNSHMLHEGWYNAANKTISFLTDYLKKNDVGSKNIKLWLSGYSRGAAVMNLVGGLLDNRFDSEGKYIFCMGDDGTPKATLTHDNLFAYTFETPQGANIYCKDFKHPKDPVYNNIFNVINPNDFVTKVGFSKGFGFTRFGIDRFITGKLNNPEGFDENRNTVKALYGRDRAWTCDSLKLYSLSAAKVMIDVTNFVTFAVDLVTTFVDSGTSFLPGFFSEDDTKVNYDANVLTTIVLDEVADRIGSRENYKEKYEGPARLMVKLFVNDETGAGQAGDIILTILKLALMGIAESIFGVLAKLVWNYFADEDDVGFFEELEPLIYVIARVYSEFPNEILGLVASLSDIFSNHDTELSIAFLMAQDTLYVDDYNINNPDDPIKISPLLETGSFRRVRFHNFNDLGLYDLDDNRAQKVSVDGSYVGASAITRCSQGYAVGYYHYLTYEAMEIFMPPYHNYQLNFTEYSCSIWHEVTATSYVYRLHNEVKEDGKYYMDGRTLYNEPDEWAGVDTQSTTFAPIRPGS